MGAASSRLSLSKASRDFLLQLKNRSRLEAAPTNYRPPSAVRRLPSAVCHSVPVTKIYKIDSENPDPGIIQDAADVIKRGGVIAFPTRCLYGLGADALNSEAVDRIFKIKQRPADKPILLLIDNPGRLKNLVIRISDPAERLMKRFWPGRLTLVFEAADGVPEYLTAGSGKIGIRLAGHPAAAALAGSIQVPLTGTSANISGQPGCHRIEDLPPAVIDQLDLILDAGSLEKGVGSTVVDVTATVPKVLRQGAVSETEIFGTLS